MKALIVCHAGTGVGLGHLTRSLTVACALRQHFGANVQILVQGEPLERRDLAAFPHRFIARDVCLLDALAQEQRVALVLLDLQPLQVPKELARVLRDYRGAGTKVVAIDGLLDWRPDLDLIFLPSFQFKPPENLRDGAPIIFGWDCILLDDSWVPVAWKPGHRVLALTGGSDTTQLGRHLPDQLDQALPENVELHWVTGPFAKRPVWPPTHRIRMLEHVAPSGLGALIQQSHYAITVFGVSFFELLYAGVPTVVFSPYGDRDAHELAAIARAGVALVAIDEYDAISQLNILLLKNDLARQLSINARTTLHASGAQRLCMTVASLFP